MDTSNFLSGPVIPGVSPAQALPGLRVPGSGESHLDEFAKRAGPDVSYGSVEVYTLFAVDPSTHQLQISIVDSTGRLVRTIPSQSVGEMLAAMANYGRL